MNGERSYLIDCLFKAREDETAQPLIDFGEGNDGRAIIRLKGYAVVPREEYEALRKIADDLAEEHAKAPPSRS